MSRLQVRVMHWTLGATLREKKYDSADISTELTKEGTSFDIYRHGDTAASVARGASLDFLSAGTGFWNSAPYPHTNREGRRSAGYA